MKEVSGWQNWGHFYKSLLGYLLTCEYSGKHHSALCNRSGVGLKENRSGQIAGLQFRNGKHITVTFTTGTFLGHHGSSKSAWTSLQQSLCNNYVWYCKVPYNPCLLNRCVQHPCPRVLPYTCPEVTSASFLIHRIFGGGLAILGFLLDSHKSKPFSPLRNHVLSSVRKCQYFYDSWYSLRFYCFHYKH